MQAEFVEDQLLPTTAHPLELRERGFKLYCKRHTLPEIGVALGVPSATIAGWSMRGKWKARRAMVEAPPPVDAGTPSSSVTTVTSDIDNMTFAEKQAQFRDKAATLALKGVEEAGKLAPGELVRQANNVAKLIQSGQKALDLEKSSPSVIVNVGLLARAAHMSDLQDQIPLANAGEVLTIQEVTSQEATGLQPVAPASAQE